MLLLGVAATISVLVTVGIVFALIEEGTGFWSNTSAVDFLTGTEWFPGTEVFGVLPLLSASLLIALIAAIVAVPLGLGCAIYLSEYAGEGVRKVVKPILELLAGMPTIVLGFFAFFTLTPALRDIGVLPEGRIYNALAAGIVVGLLIVPLIASLSEDALRAVPRAMREGAYGLGATKRVVATRIVFPAALSGVMASIVLALSRAVGETMAVTLAAGSQPKLTGDVTEGMQTITAAIVQISKGEATRGSIEYSSIFAIALVLFIVTLIINIGAIKLVRRFRTIYQ
jgi:phosphate transport system permease protein